ncbi:MAG: hypothetical protein JWM05_1956 [Acidimicrobiales bacterium]|nr:hypothetical protein [Acidimicrobiales bacterium]
MPRTILEGVSSRVVCVTGMHRSGTSVAARAVNLLGVSFGSPESLMPPGSDNPTGYWENRYVKELDDELLARLGGAWDVPPVLELGWEQDALLDDLRARGAAILARDLGIDGPDAPALVGWKEPRLSLLLPFWRTVVPIDTTVVVVRDPREVAASLLARNAMPVAEAALLWLRSLLAARADSEALVLVRHRDLTGDLPGALADVARQLGLAVPDDRTLASVSDLVDPTLLHHTAVSGPIEDEHPVLRLALEVWDDGRLALDALPAALATSIREGWLGPPANRHALAQARADAADLRERLRKRLRQQRGQGPDGGPAETDGPGAP